MPTETRYMMIDEHTVNGLTAYRLAKEGYDEHLVAIIWLTEGNPTVYWGIRWWKRSADGVETEMGPDIGLPKAIVSRIEAGEGIQTNFAFIEAAESLNRTDAIVVRVYAKFEGYDWQLQATFITEQLGAQQLDAGTPDFYYYTEYLENDGEMVSGWEPYTAVAWFHWGHITYFNSRIEDFKWTPAPKPVVTGDALASIIM